MYLNINSLEIGRYSAFLTRPDLLRVDLPLCCLAQASKLRAGALASQNKPFVSFWAPEEGGGTSNELKLSQIVSASRVSSPRLRRK